MKQTSFITAAAALTLLIALPAQAEEGALSAEQEAAMAMVATAAAHVESDGIASLVEAVNNKDSRYMDGDLYLFVLDVGGVIVGHPFKPELIGLNPSKVLDADGNEFMSRLVAAANAHPDGSWVDYRWSTPSGTVGTKSSWLVHRDGHTLGAGVVVE